MGQVLFAQAVGKAEGEAKSTRLHSLRCPLAEGHLSLWSRIGSRVPEAGVLGLGAAWQCLLHRTAPTHFF